MSWHLTPDLVDRYRDGRLDGAASYAAETHLAACATCQGLARDRVGPARLEAVWAEIVDRVDEPAAGPVERALRRLGIPEHAARLLAAVPALTVPWITSVTLVLAFAVWSAHLHPARNLPFLLLAPVIPLVGVATAHGPGIDPFYEVGVAAPYRGLRLLLLRAAAVLVVSLLLSTLAALALPGLGWSVAAWVLPAFALTSLTLAAGTFVPTERAAAAVGGTWLAAALGAELAANADLVAFGAVGQLAAAATAVGGAAAVVARRDRFDSAQDSHLPA